MDIDEYKNKTLQEIRKSNNLLSKMSDEKLIHLYQLWSETNYCAGWITFNDRAIKEFYKWAVTPPYLYER